MAAFASDRRSGWVRVLVLILCALFIFAVVATPPAFALSETVALFTAASVLSAAVAALGFKLSSDAEGQATLNQMVKDFAAVSWSLGLVAVGDKVNGLLNGVQYIKMQVLNGKTYLDQRIVAWCQQWLGTHGVYDNGSIIQEFPISDNKIDIDFSTLNFSGPTIDFDSALNSLVLDSSVLSALHTNTSDLQQLRTLWNEYPTIISSDVQQQGNFSSYSWLSPFGYARIADTLSEDSLFSIQSNKSKSFFASQYVFTWSYAGIRYKYHNKIVCVANFLLTNSDSNNTGLSGTDTIGADYKDKTLDQILDGLKTWAQDWYDAGADSATNTVAGAKDLPLTVGDQAASANPALNPDVVYNPPFALPWPDVRSGETTAGTITAGQENASAAETATADVAENQTVIDSLVTWALNYINPDTGLFSKFPLCVPYDAYLLVTSSLGADSVGSDSIFGAAPDDLNGVVIQGIEAQSDFQPIINIDHDFELDGATYPISITIDLSPWQPLITFFREGMALLLVAELIGSEYKRIRGH
jgi:hypothetical protein